MGLSILKSIGLEFMASLNFDSYEKNVKDLKNNKRKIPNVNPSEFSLLSRLMSDG
jgi:hypothetical protein